MRFYLRDEADDEFAPRQPMMYRRRGRAGVFASAHG